MKKYSFLVAMMATMSLAACNSGSAASHASNVGMAIFTGSLSSYERSFHYELPHGQTIADRTCAAGAIIDGKPVLIILGKDNHVLYSNNNKQWSIHSM